MFQVYQPVSNLLGRLSNCESLYTQLSFLKPKWYYVRKDPVSIWQLSSGYARETITYFSTAAFSLHISGRGRGEGNLYSWKQFRCCYNWDQWYRHDTRCSESTDWCLPNTAIFNHFVSVIIIIVYFISLSNFRYQAIGAAQHPSTFTTILHDLENCKQTYDSMESDRLGLLGLGISKEICILQSLLKARQAIIDYAFQESCMAVFVCKQQLNEWKAACQNQDYAEVSR